jgi:acetyl esterase/lipase
VAVVIHGGFWRNRYDLIHTGHLCVALAAAGIATWNIEYRRIGDPGGAWPGTFLDVAAATDHLRVVAESHDLTLERVVALGHSAGGHLALWLSARRRLPAGSPLAATDPLPLRRAVSLAGVSDLRMAWELRLSDGAVAELLGGSPDVVPERYAAASPAALLPLGVPQLLIHGTDDESVPYRMSEVYHEAAIAAGDPTSLLTIPDAGHLALIDPRCRTWRVVSEAVERCV